MHSLIYSLIGYLLFVALSWIWLVSRYLRRQAFEPKVEAAEDPPPDAELPSVTILVPCRNEEENVEICLRSLCCQDYPRLRVVAVDDASEDGTREIIQKLQREHPSLELVDAGGLPVGWVGKNHALHRGVQRAEGEWLLFTDADTVHEPDCLRITVHYAMDKGIDLLSIPPAQECRTFWEGTVQPIVFSLLGYLFPLERVNSPHDPIAAANGQFILIRRRVYDAIGGHEAIKGEVLEDVHLAEMAKEASFRIYLAFGPGLLRTRMYSSFGELWEGWVKNLFPLHQNDAIRIGRSVASLLIFAVLPAATLILSLLSGLLEGENVPVRALIGVNIATLFVISVASSLVLRLYQYRARFGPLTPLGAAVVVGMLLSSTYNHRIRGGVRWKGRYYTP